MCRRQFRHGDNPCAGTRQLDEKSRGSTPPCCIAWR
jgi:hypothetical protein